ncbi:MinD/ParA family ATP-binding protein [Halobellus ruber]|uniref:CDP-4-keto-6-deoxy-D-glucose-3-dehydrase n=1 Tax=Halobellus ruber TaxID=2761102 RepID=A0A7J9SFY1_9EURY|nr:CDP-4-keto-6-deoxy-D-glucose-3-dehydrase [Halobellus ruber]MBB6645865.1 CDP-4-keto-6-deoxy-D-glucose-3-dehydrase [Halobellus ruber]
MLAIAGGKGGSGKTTTALGLARAIDGPTLAVDADCDLPNLHALAGVPRAPPEGGHGHPDPAAPSDTQVVPAPRDAFEGLGSRLRELREATAELVVVDCPAGAGPDATVPLRVADRVLLVSTACAAGLRDAAKTAAMARAVGTPVVGGVVTRARVAPPGVDDLLGCPVVTTVPEATEPLDDAGVQRAYRRLARAVADRPKA